MPNTPRDTESRYRQKISAHRVAFAHPAPGFEDALSHLVKGLVAYANAYRQRYQVPIGDDPALAETWAEIARGILGLLDGPTERFDCATIDGMIRDTAVQSGYLMSLETRT